MGRHRLQLDQSLFCKSEDRSADHRTGLFRNKRSQQKRLGRYSPKRRQGRQLRGKHRQMGCDAAFGLGCLQKLYRPKQHDRLDMEQHRGYRNGDRGKTRLIIPRHFARTMQS